MRQSSTTNRGRKPKSGQTGRNTAANKRSPGRPQASTRGNQSTNSLSSASAKGNKPAASQRSSGAGSRGGMPYFQRFFTDQLKDIYYAEQRLVQALAKMKDAATTEELQEAFEDHMHQTERHARRLEKIFSSMGMRPEGKRCDAIEGIIKEVDSIIDETGEGTMTRDAALIFGAQKVEHYEIATYGGLVTMAITMDLYEQADLLDRTLIEEETTDALLTDIAENYIDIEAELESEFFEVEAEVEEGEEAMGSQREKEEREMEGQ